MRCSPLEATMGGSHLAQQVVRAQCQSPETDDATRRAYLVEVTAHQFLEVGKQDFDGPRLSGMADNLLQGVIKPSRPEAPGRRPASGPIARVLQVVVRAKLNDEHLAAAVLRPRPGMGQRTAPTSTFTRARPCWEGRACVPSAASAPRRIAPAPARRPPRQRPPRRPSLPPTSRGFDPASRSPRPGRIRR